MCVLPKKLLARAQESLLFYRERVLARASPSTATAAPLANGCTRFSALFREIENAFLLPERADDGEARIAGKIDATVCAACPRCKTCDRPMRSQSLVRLVRVGRAKGKANLIDLPPTSPSTAPTWRGSCLRSTRNSKATHGARRRWRQRGKGGALLARQAHGVSEIMRDLALRESEEYSLSSDEDTLARTLQERGILSSEIFVYGEGGTLTVSMTLDESVPARKACLAASDALGVPLALAEKAALNAQPRLLCVQAQTPL